MASERKIIYHLDDDPEILDFMKVVCTQRLKVEYLEFQTVESFLKAIKVKAPDLCIIDLNLEESPGAGFAVTKAIRNKASGKMPIIVMSRRSDPKDISLALDFGASDFLPKPVDIELLVEKVTYLLKGAENNSFPIHKMRNPIKGTLEVHLKPKMIDEVYLHMNSKFFVLKNTPVMVQHTIIKKIFGVPKKEFLVNDCQLESHDGSYSLRMLPKEPDDEYFEKIHRFILSMT